MTERSGGLDGIRVGVPASRQAEAASRLIARHGGEAIVGPVMTEIPESPEVLRDVTREVTSREPGFSVHLTGVGTRYWFDAAEELELLEQLLGVLGEATIVARGPKTAKALRERELEPTWMPSGERSADIVEWLQGRVGPLDTVALQRYGRPIPEVVAPIEAAGAHVIEVAPYRWGLPEDTAEAEDLVRRIVDGDVQAMIVTSAPQIQLLFELAERLGSATELRDAIRARVFVGAVGEVAASGVQDVGCRADLVADPARMGALVRDLAASRDEILGKAGRA